MLFSGSEVEAPSRCVEKRLKRPAAMFKNGRGATWSVLRHDAASLEPADGVAVGVAVDG